MISTISRSEGWQETTHNDNRDKHDKKPSPGDCDELDQKRKQETIVSATLGEGEILP